ncbi:L,D-transpeptidase family protein [Anaerohalosphaeraceae bacterium U12dextr]
MKVEYRPYQGRNGNNTRTRIILIVLAVAIVGLVALNRWKKKKAEQAQLEEPSDTVTAVETAVPPSPQKNLRTTIPDTTPEQLELAAGSGSARTETVAAAPQTTMPTPQPAVETPQPAQAPVAQEGGQPAPVADTITSPEAAAMIRQAVQDIAAGKIIAARDQLNHALDLNLSDAVREEVKKQLTKLADTWLFSKQVAVGDTMTELYKVQPGDVLAVLCRKYKVPHEAIERINGITNPERLQAGQTIKVVHGPFNAVVSKKNFTMDIYLQGVFVKQYKVGLGKIEHDTPTGKWRAAAGGKMIKPTWTDPDSGRVYQGSDPDYPLGSRWIALEGLDGAAKGRTGFAIHGTKEPETIGTRASRGCIRLFNGDVVEVYDLLEAGVSEVVVIE